VTSPLRLERSVKYWASEAAGSVERCSTACAERGTVRSRGQRRRPQGSAPHAHTAAFRPRHTGRARGAYGHGRAHLVHRVAQQCVNIVVAQVPGNPEGIGRRHGLPVDRQAQPLLKFVYWFVRSFWLFQL
jgi:hypothetical protein